MNAKYLIAATAVFASVASGMAHAEGDKESQFAIQFQGSRTRAEVAAEAARVPTTRSNEPLGSRVAAPVQSTVDAKVLRAQAAEALRTGQIPRGEVGSI